MSSNLSKGEMGHLRSTSLRGSLLLIEHLKTGLISTSWTNDEKDSRARNKLTAVTKWLLNVACQTESEALHDSILDIAESLNLDEVVRDSAFEPTQPLNEEEKAKISIPDFITAAEECSGSCHLVQASCRGSSAFFTNQGMADNFLSAAEANDIYTSSSADPDSVMRRLVATSDRPAYLQCMTELLLGSPELDSKASLTCLIHTRTDGQPVPCAMNMRASFSSDGEDLTIGVEIAPLPSVPVSLGSSVRSVRRDEKFLYNDDTTSETEPHDPPPRICGFKGTSLFFPPSAGTTTALITPHDRDYEECEANVSESLTCGATETSPSTPSSVSEHEVFYQASEVFLDRSLPQEVSDGGKSDASQSSPYSVPVEMFEASKQFIESTLLQLHHREILNTRFYGYQDESSHEAAEAEPDGPPPRAVSVGLNGDALKHSIRIPSLAGVFTASLTGLVERNSRFLARRRQESPPLSSSEPEGSPPEICGARDNPLASPALPSTRNQLQLHHREILNTGFQGETACCARDSPIFPPYMTSHTSLQLHHREILNTYLEDGKNEIHDEIDETEPSDTPPRICGSRNSLLDSASFPSSSTMLLPHHREILNTGYLGYEDESPLESAEAEPGGLPPPAVRLTRGASKRSSWITSSVAGASACSASRVPPSKNILLQLNHREILNTGFQGH